MISVGEALAQVCAAATALGAERVTLGEALGRVAIEDAVSSREVPAAANSAMDGYAVRHADLATSPAALRIVAVQPAGTVTETPVDAGTAVKLFTGSVIPGGADTVVRVEDTEERDGTVTVRVAPARGANIRNAGEDIRPGQVVLAAGTLIGPADVGLLASIGRATVLVHRRPQVAILSTGTELVEVDELPGPGQVVNSNAYTLAAAARDAGGSRSCCRSSATVPPTSPPRSPRRSGRTSC
jgi:molybdopterin molybdotransferase